MQEENPHFRPGPPITAPQCFPQKSSSKETVLSVISQKRHGENYVLIHQQQNINLKFLSVNVSFVKTKFAEEISSRCTPVCQPRRKSNKKMSDQNKIAFFLLFRCPKWFQNHTDPISAINFIGLSAKALQFWDTHSFFAPKVYGIFDRVTEPDICHICHISYLYDLYDKNLVRNIFKGI